MSLPAVSAVLLALALLRSVPALGVGVVGSGTPESCTEAALDTALAGGGHVTFNCGAEPVTTIITSTKTISANTSIDGGGLIALSGGGTVQHFVVNEGVILDLHSVIISGGSACQGGAISNNGTLTVTDSTFSGNADPGCMSGGGGAIWNVGGTITVTNSTFAGNSSGYNNGGGALWVQNGTVTVTNSTFSGNSAYGGGAIIIGAGASGSTLSITNSTFSGNTTTSGGVIATYELAVGRGTVVAISNSTFAANTGTAIVNGGTLTVTNSTLVSNGIENASICGDTGNAPCQATLTNTIVANSAGGNCTGTITDGGHNLDSDGTCGVGPATDPLLHSAGLASNGGPTQTIALQAGSPAINSGDETICSAPPVNNRDQRGYVRPGTGYTNCSIGAFEFNSPGPPACEVGDCNNDSAVTIDELISLVNIALGTALSSECPNGVPSGAEVNVALIIQAVNNALDGCVTVPVSTPTPTATAPVQTPTVTSSCAVTVSGQVYDATAGPAQGVAGAQVFVHLDVPRTFSATADADGRYSLLVPEPYGCRVVSLEASADGFTPTLVPVTPAALFAQPTRNFALTRP